MRLKFAQPACGGNWSISTGAREKCLAPSISKPGSSCAPSPHRAPICARTNTILTTSRPIVGSEIPEWSRLKEIALAAAPIFAGIHTQSLDVALTENGPVLLEMNFDGDLSLAQLATGKGVLEDDYPLHLREWVCRLSTTQ
jgi:hypothetical protein